MVKMPAGIQYKSELVSHDKYHAAIKERWESPRLGEVCWDDYKHHHRRHRGSPMYTLVVFQNGSLRLNNAAPRREIRGTYTDIGVGMFSTTDPVKFMDRNGANLPRAWLNYEPVTGRRRSMQIRATQQYLFLQLCSGAAVAVSDESSQLIYDPDLPEYLQGAYAVSPSKLSFVAKTMGKVKVYRPVPRDEQRKRIEWTKAVCLHAQALFGLQSGAQGRQAKFGFSQFEPFSRYDADEAGVVLSGYMEGYEPQQAVDEIAESRATSILSRLCSGQNSTNNIELINYLAKRRHFTQEDYIYITY